MSKPFFRVIPLLGMIILGLSACADAAIPHWLTGEPDDSVLNQPRPVGHPPSINGDGYVLLGTLPERPKDFPVQATTDSIIQQLKSEKAENDSVKPAESATKP